jgi:hypothetical protein
MEPEEATPGRTALSNVRIHILKKNIDGITVPFGVKYLYRYFPFLVHRGKLYTDGRVPAGS